MTSLPPSHVHSQTRMSEVPTAGVRVLQEGQVWDQPRGHSTQVQNQRDATCVLSALLMELSLL